MRNRAFLALSAVTLTALTVLSAPAIVVAQAQDPNQVIEAARKASPRSGDEALKYFEDELAEKIREATKRSATTRTSRQQQTRPELRGALRTCVATTSRRPTPLWSGPGK